MNQLFHYNSISIKARKLNSLCTFVPLCLCACILLFSCSSIHHYQKANFFATLYDEAQMYQLTLSSNNIPLVINEKIAKYISIYNNGSRKYLTGILTRAHKYFPMMKVAFKEAGLPEELVYLPIIESGFNMNAYSPAHASGPWQFMKGTGRLYNLHADWWVDERRNPEKSTIAAVRHLKELYAWLKDWYLALAAYNAGGGKVSKAIKKFKSRDFWELTKGKRWILRKETKEYVPKFIAVTIICENLDKFGFSEIEKEKPILYEIVEIPDATDLNLIAECCGSTYEEIKSLNPELKKWATPPKYNNYKLRIPYGSKNIFLNNFNTISPEERITFRRHKIKSGESVWSIASKYNVPRDMIMEMNKLGKQAMIREGHYLIIPIRGVEKAKEIDKLFKNEISYYDGI